ncbi:hypothetical protein CO172_01255 [Candidatus Uhrbacteria bacterium CG_4_9_14_3_um_filter_36_7]|uniref:Uncharacterized protein n=1 Tax=Candidatus Uhrbacteria bacterium CG_4_9_14_3_um_filter_36_7 TaxID=1975033 RepID=A0A2M7XHX3_9BACT|nr:MAG: hypothetical protein CO172_01255 [Candidatus Uhrbacteria bacterium CG_4_9_14_3_um_filter_36_7]
MNISIPLFILLVPFALFLLFYIFYSLFNLYHLLRYGISEYKMFLVIVVYMGISIFLFGSVLYGFQQFDWLVSFDLSSIFSNTSTHLFEPIL